MFQNDRSRVLLRANGNTDDQMLGRLTGETVTCSLKKSLNGFGFTIIDGLERGEHYLQVKDILPDGPAARDGKLQRGDILVYVNDVHVLGYSHTDVVRIFQGLSVGDALNLTVCRGYPLTLNLNDPQIDVVSLNGVHYSTNGTHKEHLQSTTESPFHTVRIRKGDHGFGFTIADSTSGQRIKAIVDRQRCRGFSENDLLVSINGQDLSDKQHNDVVNILIHCPKDAETTFVVRRGEIGLNLSPSSTRHENRCDEVRPTLRVKRARGFICRVYRESFLEGEVSCTIFILRCQVERNEENTSRDSVWQLDKAFFYSRERRRANARTRWIRTGRC